MTSTPRPSRRPRVSARSTGRRLATRLGVVAALTLAVTVVPPAPAAQELVPTATDDPTCVTPVAPDGFEPPCNPYLSSPSWGAAHRNSYAQASSPLPAPEPGEDVAYEHTVPVLGVPLFPLFTEPYADGGRVAWMATVATPDGRYVYKVDTDTGKVIASFGSLNDLSLPGAGGVSGAYSVLDHDNHLIVARERTLDVYGDAVEGDRLSPIKRLTKFTFPDDALCGSQDSLVGITMLYDGRIAFASALGVVGTIPSDVADMTAANLATTSINGDRCATASTSDTTLDQVSNSIAADENGGIYVVTSNAMYAFSWDGETVEEAWRAPYDTGAESAIRIGAGSGSTPTLMGSGPDQDRFVVITDGQTLMHLNLFWRDEIPADWEGIPGESRRLACKVPVTFGDADATESQSEQSVLVRGYGSVVVNNQLQDDTLISLLPGNARLLAAALAGGDPNNAPYGIERLDWDPETRTCSSVWVNEEVSIPNGIPGMSIDSGLVYGIGQRDGMWGLEGIDFATGESVLRVDSTATPDNNAAYSATTVGPDNTIWTGTLAGYTIFRGPERSGPSDPTDPTEACADRTAPTSTVRTARSEAGPATSLTRSRVRVAGSSADRACDEAAPGGVDRVEVSVQLRRGDGCRSLRADGTLRAKRACSDRLWLATRLDAGTGSWVRRGAAELKEGRYRVVSRATDTAGNRETALERVLLRVR